MIGRIVFFIILVPVAVILIAIAVANRLPVAFTLDPFHPGNPGLTAQLPLFVYLFAALAIGIVIGSFATWIRQGQYRKKARHREHEVEKLRRESQQRGSASTLPAYRA